MNENDYDEKEENATTMMIMMVMIKIMTRQWQLHYFLRPFICYC